MKYLLTGITGQIGCVMTKTLMDQGHQVVGMYRRTANGSFDRLEEAGLLGKSSLRMCSGDVTDYSSIDRIIKQHKPDVIMNIAAASHVGESFKSPISNLQITGAGCINCLEAVRNNMSMDYSPKFVQWSSSEMFGSNYDTRWGEAPPYQEPITSGIVYEAMSPEEHEARRNPPEVEDEKYQDENTPLSANSPYAAAKIYAHNMTELYRKAYGMYANSIILFNTESEYRGMNFVTRKVTDYTARLYHFMNKWHDKIGLTVEYDYFCDPDYITVVDSELGAPHGRFPKLRLGNIASMRDWTYAQDACDGILLSLTQKEPDTYVICSGQTRTIQELVEVSFAEIGLKDFRNFLIIDPAFYRPVEVDFLRGDSSKIRALGWEPKTDFNSIISIMVGEDIQRTSRN